MCRIPGFDGHDAFKGCPARRAPGGFTLIELLVVGSILSLLVAILLPSLAAARMRSRIVCVHADLRQITNALDAYALHHRDKLPPTRSGCGTNVTYQLPVELASERFLPPSPNKIPQAHVEDFFNPQHTYRYRAPGPIWFNGSFFDYPDSTWRTRAGIWVPDDFPVNRSETGRFYHARTSEPRSPVAYAVWSSGPDSGSPKFPRHEGTDQIDDSRFPVPRRYWLTGVRDAGLIVHFKGRTGLTYQSP